MFSSSSSSVGVSQWLLPPPPTRRGSEASVHLDGKTESGSSLWTRTSSLFQMTFPP